jgi:hypothetical protein
VSDLKAARSRAEAFGYQIIGYDDAADPVRPRDRSSSAPPSFVLLTDCDVWSHGLSRSQTWHQFFLNPKEALGIVVQFAHTPPRTSRLHTRNTQRLSGHPLTD